MEYLLIEGGQPLLGEVAVQGAKNSALPIMAATILGTEESTLLGMPDLQDIKVMLQVLEAIGVEGGRWGEVLKLAPRKHLQPQVPSQLMRKLRVSNLVMGPLLARCGYFRVPYPGGCAIGSRPVDLHLKGFAALGAEVKEEQGYIEARSSGLKGSVIYLDFPSVGATENLMMAAVLAEGVTLIHNAAREPEIVDLQDFLNKMGARIEGAGQDTIRIEGVKELKGGSTGSYRTA